MSPLDQIAYWDILLIPFFIGVLSGGQTMHAKMGHDFTSVLGNIWGWIYWLSRGFIPVGAYLIWFFVQTPHAHSWQVALICGFGAETILRSKLYVTTKSESGKKDDVFKGVFDLIEFWQSLCLKQAGIARADVRQKYVKNLLGAFDDFPAICQKFQTNAPSFPASLQSDINQRIDMLVTAFNKELSGTAQPCFIALISSSSAMQCWTWWAKVDCARSTSSFRFGFGETGRLTHYRFHDA